MPLSLMLALGLAAGVHAASYGAYKDSPHESFLPRRLARELTIAACSGCASGTLITSMRKSDVLGLVGSATQPGSSSAGRTDDVPEM